MDPHDNQFKDTAAKFQAMSPEEREQFLADNPEMAQQIADFVQAIEESGGMLSVIAQNTIRVLTEEPEKREEWVDLMQRLVERAQEKDDQPMMTFAGALVRLSLGDPIDTLSPDLEGEHLAAWEQIKAGLA